MDHLPQHLDRRPLCPHDLVADDAGDDLVVADPPHCDALVPLDERLGELVELLVVASLDIHLDEIETFLRHRSLECLAERRRHPANLTKAG